MKGIFDFRLVIFDLLPRRSETHESHIETELQIKNQKSKI